MKASLAAGCNFWNAGTWHRPQELQMARLIRKGEFYGTPENNSLTLMNKYFTKYPEDAEKVVLSVVCVESIIISELHTELTARKED